MKVKRMGITEILRRIWLFSANKTKSSESFNKQPTQLIVELNSSLRHIIVTLLTWLGIPQTSVPRSSMAWRVAHAVTSVNPYPWISVEPRQTLIKSWTSLDKGAPPANMSRILPPKRILIFRKTIVSRIGVDSPFLIASNLKLRNNSWLFVQVARSYKVFSIPSSKKWAKSLFDNFWNVILNVSSVSLHFLEITKLVFFKYTYLEQ